MRSRPGQVRLSPPGARRCRGAVLAVAAAIALAGCTGGYSPPMGTSPVGRIDVSPSAATIAVGQSVELQIAAYDTLGVPVTAGFIVTHSNRGSVLLEVVSSTAVRATGLAPGLDRIQVSDQHLQRGGSALIRVGTP